MRYRLMASFQGAPYQAGIGPSDEEVTLFAACPPPEELGFRSSSGHWHKRVSVEEIDALWESRPIGRYHGERCMVLDDLGDRMHIAYLGRDLYMARRLGFWEVDRGVFEVVVPRQDITDLGEERGEYELAVFDPARPQPARLLGRRPPRDLGVQSARLRLRTRHRPSPLAGRRAPRAGWWTPGRRGPRTRASRKVTADGTTANGACATTRPRIRGTRAPGPPYGISIRGTRRSPATRCRAAGVAGAPAIPAGGKRPTPAHGMPVRWPNGPPGRLPIAGPHQPRGTPTAGARVTSRAHLGGMAGRMAAGAPAKIPAGTPGATPAGTPPPRVTAGGAPARIPAAGTPARRRRRAGKTRTAGIRKTRWPGARSARANGIPPRRRSGVPVP